MIENVETYIDSDFFVRDDYFLSGEDNDIEEGTNVYNNGMKYLASLAANAQEKGCCKAGNNLQLKLNEYCAKFQNNMGVCLWAKVHLSHNVQQRSSRAEGQSVSVRFGGRSASIADALIQPLSSRVNPHEPIDEKVAQYKDINAVSDALLRSKKRMQEDLHTVVSLVDEIAKRRRVDILDEVMEILQEPLTAVEEKEEDDEINELVKELQSKLRKRKLREQGTGAAPSTLAISVVLGKDKAWHTLTEGFDGHPRAKKMFKTIFEPLVSAMFRPGDTCSTKKTTKESGKKNKIHTR